MADKKTIYSKLLEIQTTLVSEKDKYNKFGDFSYRSAEDIEYALKPLLNKTNATIYSSYSISRFEDRYYIQAIVIFADCETGETLTSTAFAREAEVKKGMDVAQITGAASSYALKYALQSLFALDSGNDPDSQDNREKPKEEPAKQSKEEPKKEAKKNPYLQYFGKTAKELADKHDVAISEIIKFIETDIGYKLAMVKDLDMAKEAMDSLLNYGNLLAKETVKEQIEAQGVEVTEIEHYDQDQEF